MIQIRRDTFETNSSSTHSLTMVDKSDFLEWKKGKLYFDGYKNFLTYDEVIAKLRESTYHKNDKICQPDFDPAKWDEYQETCDEYIFMNYENVDDALAGEYEYYTYDQYWEHHEQWESFETTHTTKNGDEVVAFGYYGYDC